MIDFDWYRSFAAIYRNGTVTGAAEERGLTQPAVTQHLAALEAALGGALFTRTARRMLPTERGKMLYTQTVQALETLEQVSRQLRQPASHEPPLVRLGTPREYFAEVALGQLKDLPLRVQVQFGSARSLLDSLQRGDLDLVIATERMTLREVEYRKLREEVFVLVGGPALTPPYSPPADAEQRNALATWLLGQPWLSYGTDLPIIRRFWRQLFTQRPAITPALIIPDLLVIAKAIALGRGVSVLPSYLCQPLIEAGQLQLIWEPTPVVSNDLWLAYRRQDRQQPAVVAVVDGLKV
jgi:DNA-binding transcriptional LysR family regulator